MSERTEVQDPLIQYASDLKWTPLTREESEKLRKGESGLFYYDILKDQLLKLNDFLDDSLADDVIKRLENVKPTIEGNLQILKFLRGQVPIPIPSQKRDMNVRLISDDIDENVYHVTDEWYYTNGRYGNRADVIFLINGIPIVIAETKSTKKREGIAEGVDQIRRYHRETPELMISNQIFDVTHMFDFYYGVTWNLDRKGLFKWKYEDKENFEQKVKQYFDKARILQFLKEYIVFFRKDDVLFKIIMKQHQTRAVEKIVSRAVDRKKKTGLIWHSQGSGKTFTMILAAEKILRHEAFDKPTVLMLVDRNELESQLFRNLDAYGFKEGETMEIADSKKDLKRLLSKGYRGLIVSMVHKFDRMPKDVNTSDKVFVFVDEAHRTTSGNLGNYLMAALPNATYFGLTGTPIDKILYGRGTFKIFGKDDDKGYLDKYSMAASIEDGTTEKLRYTLAPNEIRVPSEMLEKEFFELMEKEGVSDIDELNKLLEKSVNLRNFLKAPDRVQKVAKFIAHHYKTNVEPMGYKAFVVGVDRDACIAYKEELDKHLPAEYSTIVFSPAHNDPEYRKKHYLTADQEKRLKGKDFPKKDKLPKILIVTDKLLTGYDAPILYCMYLDKPMKDHTLLQAIARVNRPYEDEKDKKKPCGFVLDFVGIFERLEKALAFDSDVVGSCIENIDVLKKSFKSLMDGEAKPYLELVKGKVDDKAIEAAVDYFEDKDKREDFYKFYKRIETMYEILSPDKFLGDYIQFYVKLSQLYDVVRNAYAKRIYVDKDLARKTANLVKEHVQADYVTGTLDVYDIDENTLAKLKQKGGSDNRKVINLKKSVLKHISDNQDDQPYLISIGDKAEAVIEQYDDRQLSTQVALKRLEKIIEEINQAKKEQEEKKLGSAFTVYWHLKEAGIDNPEKIALDINKVFDSLPNWKSNSEEARNLTMEFYKILLKATDKSKAVEVVEMLIKDQGRKS